MAEKITRPIISIIVPVYNVENYLRQAIDSLINQTVKEIEIICINDCSPDNSLTILKEYEQKDSRVKIIDLKENKGQGNARNIAIQEAKGGYIMFLDPDDWYELDTCEKAYNQISKNDNDFVIFDFSRFYEETSTITLDSKYSETFSQLQNKNSINPQNCNFQFLHNAFIWNKIYKISFIKENNILFSTHRFLEDLPFTIKSFALTNSISFIPEFLYFYRKKENENMALNYTEYYNHVIDSHRQNYLYLKDLGNENLIKNYLVYTIKSTLYWFDIFGKINSNIKEYFYTKLREYYLLLNKSTHINSISSKINYRRFKNVLKFNDYKAYSMFCIFQKQILQRIFNIKNIQEGKEVTILGLKIKIKRSEGENGRNNK